MILSEYELDGMINTEQKTHQYLCLERDLHQALQCFADKSNEDGHAVGRAETISTPIKETSS